MLDVVLTPVILVVGRQKQENQEFEALYNKQDSVRKEEKKDGSCRRKW
jgi:hypothetical protein